MQLDTIKSIEKMSILETAVWAFVSGCKITDQSKTFDLCVTEFIDFAGCHQIDKNCLKMSYYRMQAKIMKAKGIAKEKITLDDVTLINQTIDDIKEYINLNHGRG